MKSILMSLAFVVSILASFTTIAETWQPADTPGGAIASVKETVCITLGAAIAANDVAVGITNPIASKTIMAMDTDDGLLASVTAIDDDYSIMSSSIMTTNDTKLASKTLLAKTGTIVSTPKILAMMTDVPGPAI